MKLSISTSRAENLLGCGYLLFYQFFLPGLIGTVAYFLGQPISPSLLNVLFFIINFVAVVCIFRSFLWRSVQAAWENPWRCLRCAALGLAVYYVAMFLFSFVILQIDPEFSNANDQAILELTTEHGKIIAFCTVFLVPVVEETLFRGLIFQQLYRKNHFLGYCVSAALFSLIHIVGFIGIESWRTLLLCFIQYLPAGIALAGAYKQADTVIAPILMHMTINQIALSAMR